MLLLLHKQKQKSGCLLCFLPAVEITAPGSHGVLGLQDSPAPFSVPCLPDDGGCAGPRALGLWLFEFPSGRFILYTRPRPQSCGIRREIMVFESGRSQVQVLSMGSPGPPEGLEFTLARCAYLFCG